MFACRRSCLRWRSAIAASVAVTFIMGVPSRSVAEDGFFDRYLSRPVRQPTFLSLEANAWVPPVAADAPQLAGDLPLASALQSSRSMLDPEPLAPPTRRFQPAAAEQPAATGSTGAEEARSCPDPAPHMAAQPPAVADGAGPRETFIGRGRAVWYELPGNTASGEPYDPAGFTAGHRTLPFGTSVRVVNERNGRSAVVRINDRGPVGSKFVIDLSRASARHLGIVGTDRVALYRLERSPGEDNVQASSDSDAPATTGAIRRR